MPLARLPFAVPLALLLALAAAHPAAGSSPPPRLAGATEVDPPGKYPFAAALVDRHTPDAWRGRFCDGAVVADRWVLTAARCLEDRRPADVDVVIGRHDLSAAGGERLAAVAFHLHPRHDGADLYDAALVELAAPTAAQPASLPSADPLPGPALAVGWGDTFDPNRLPRTLQQSAIPLLDDARCTLIHGDAFSPAFMVCAGDLEHGGAGACSGDRGAPLFV
ncbi:MAG: serine protease, partial [Acidimicrobiia bacterium]|nr:serine protease [Acidimicrobiia bacterium]